MTTNVLEAITEKYHSLTRSGKKLADISSPTPRNLNISPSHRSQKTAMYRKQPLHASAVHWAIPAITRLNWLWHRLTM